MGASQRAQDEFGIFISYSRRDSLEFSKQLAIALEAFGYRAIIDLQGISGGEAWQPRLSEMILGCDTVVFVLSPEAAVSPICAWEVEEATRLGKRILPAIPMPLGSVQPPKLLAQLNYTHFYREPSVPDSGFGHGLARLNGALRSDLAWLREHRNILMIADTWDKTGRGPDRLLHGTALADAERWAASRPVTAPELTDLQREYISASRADEDTETEAKRRELAERERLVKEAEAAKTEREQAQAAREEAQREALAVSRQVVRRTRLGLAAALSLAAIAGVVGIYAVSQRSEALGEARTAGALLSGQVALQAESSLESFPQRSLLLAAQALRITEDHQEPTVPAAKEALYHVLVSTGGVVFGGYDLPVVAADLSPDNRWLVAVPEHGGSARLWDLAGEARNVFELRGAAGSIAFSGDSRWLVTAGPEQEPARLWDLTSPDPGATARVLEASASPFRFSSDHRWLVTGGAERSVRLWDLAAAPGTAAVVLPPHTADKLGVAISLDSRWLVTHSSYSGMLGRDVDAPRLYNLSESRPETTRVELAGHTSSVTTVVFSPDGRWLATGSAERGEGRVFRADNDVRLWDLTEAKPAAIELRGHEGPITAMAMSGDSRWLVTGSADRTARVWSLAGPAVGASGTPLPGHDGPVIGAVIAAEGTRGFTVATIAQGRQDGGRVEPTIARVWRLPQDGTSPEATVVSDKGRLVDVSLFQTSDDGRRFLVADANTVRVIELKVSPEPPPVVLHAHEGGIATAVFARDGQRVATGGQDGTVRLWSLNPSPSALPVVIPAEADEQFAVSRDHRWLVTIGADTAEGRSDSVAALRDLTATDIGARPRLLRGHIGPIFSFAFSDDSRWLATGGHDGTARLWGLRAAGPSAIPIVLTGHREAVSAVAFTTDGRWLVTGSFDATLRRWDLTRNNPAEASQILPVDGAVRRLAITTDGRWAIASGERRSVLWDLKAADPAQASALLPDADAGEPMVAEDRWLVTHGSDDIQSLKEQLRQTRDPRQRQDLQQKLKSVASVTAVLDLTSKDPIATRRALNGAGEPVGASLDGRWLVTNGLDDTPLLWPVTSNGPAAPAVTLKEHSKSVASVAFSPDGRWLVTGGYDESVWRWDLKAKDVGASSHLLARFPFAADVVAFSEDGRRVLASGTHAAYLWELGEDDAWPPPIKLPAEIGGGGFSRDGRWLVTRPNFPLSKSIKPWT
jgi:WD40 repeat protein